MTNGKQFLSLNERGRRRAVEALTDAEKREFFSEIVPEICDESLTIEGCRMIFEKSSQVPGIWNPLTSYMRCRRKVGLSEPSGSISTRTREIMRHLLRRAFAGETSDMGDASPLLDKDVVQRLHSGGKKARRSRAFGVMALPEALLSKNPEKEEKPC